jgi:hypothetical protein
MYNDGPDSNSPGKRPWFGPKRFGYGTRAQTWQGFLVAGLCVAFVVILAVVTGGHSHWMILGIIPFALIGVLARSGVGRR